MVGLACAHVLLFEIPQNMRLLLPVHLGLVQLVLATENKKIDDARIGRLVLAECASHGSAHFLGRLLERVCAENVRHLAHHRAVEAANAAGGFAQRMRRRNTRRHSRGHDPS
eukprot:Amastigsp_a508670_748.p3 type:complete len:112 gc:universal Amastigsp_a508670_748:386-51(-)